jgi:protein ImuB
LVLCETRRGAARVAACSSEARALGIAVGMPLAEARMLGGGEQRGRKEADTAFSRPFSSHRRERETPQASAWANRRGVVHARDALLVESYDRAADREALERLAEWCQRFSPLVGLEDSCDPASLFADITGLAPLFGGEALLAAQVVRDFTHRGLTVRLALADTMGAAWAIAHFGEGRRQNDECGTMNDERTTASFTSPQFAICNSQFSICNPNQHSVEIRSLPIEALRLSENLIDLLHQLGIYQIGQVEALPRQDLTARFGPQLLQRLDQAAGRRAEPVPAQPLPPELEAQQTLEYPTTQREAVEQIVEQLISQVARLLVRVGRGAVQLECRLRCEGSQEIDLSIGLFRPTASARHLFQLVRMRLERVVLPAAVSAVYTRAAVTAPLARLQQELFSDGPLKGSPRQLADLVDRLSSRLGRQAVQGVRLLADAQPELAYQYHPLLDDSGHRPRRNPAWRAQRPDLPPRPLRLLRRPIPLDAVSLRSDGPPSRFQGHRGEHRVTHTWGPERIETGWWRGRPVGRDYWRIETTTGSRFWLFRRLRDEKWFLQGAFE